nr:MAG TPA: hypothetical protein [Caudoviricetes sp.]
MENTTFIVRLLSICEVGGSCELLLDCVLVLKRIRQACCTLSIIYVVLGVPYFVSRVEI